MNYINIFGNNIVKTGVTAKARKFTRVLEQGALATIYFTDTDGYIARVIESFISKSLQIRQSVNWDTKIKHLQNTCTEKDAFSELEKIHKRITEIMSKEFKDIIFKQPEFYFNLDYYTLDLNKFAFNVNVFNQFASNDIISGRIIGVYGEILFLEQNNKSIIGINSKGLKGYNVHVSEEEILTRIIHDPKQIRFKEKHFENMTLF